MPIPIHTKCYKTLFFQLKTKGNFPRIVFKTYLGGFLNKFCLKFANWECDNSVFHVPLFKQCLPIVYRPIWPENRPIRYRYEVFLIGQTD